MNKKDKIRAFLKRYDSMPEKAPASEWDQIIIRIKNKESAYWSKISWLSAGGLAATAFVVLLLYPTNQINDLKTPKESGVIGFVADCADDFASFKKGGKRKYIALID